MKNLLMAMLALALLTMASCSSEPSKPAETEKPQPKAPELQTGRYALQKLYVTARGWARDAQPYRLESQVTSDSSKPAETEKPQPKAPELETGRYALQKLYVAARGWARDAQPYRLESQVTSDAKGKDGKADVWHASFASPAGHGAKTYVWSGTDAQDAPARGVIPGAEDSYSPTNSSTQVFDIGFLHVDSDKAFAVAQQHGGDKMLEKASDTPVLYVLDWNKATNAPVWRVIYGNSRDDAKLTVDVSAITGEFIRVEK